MSRHNRDRRRAGVLKARRLVIAPDECRRVNEARQRELVFHHLIRAAQDRANAEQQSHTVGTAGLTATVHPVPQHWTESYR